MLRRPSKEEMMMQIALVVKDRSTCSRLQVGCILTNLETDHHPRPMKWDRQTSHTRILAIGYNGMEAGGQNNCDSELPGQCGCIHAEMNALIKAPPGPKAAFITTSPCLMCARMMINAEVQVVRYHHEYRDLTAVHLLRSRSIDVGRLHA